MKKASSEYNNNEQDKIGKRRASIQRSSSIDIRRRKLLEDHQTRMETTHKTRQDKSNELRQRLLQFRQQKRRQQSQKDDVVPKKCGVKQQQQNTAKCKTIIKDGTTSKPKNFTKVFKKATTTPRHDDREHDALDSSVSSKSSGSSSKYTGSSITSSSCSSSVSCSSSGSNNSPSSPTSYTSPTFSSDSSTHDHIPETITITSSSHCSSRKQPPRHKRQQPLLLSSTQHDSRMMNNKKKITNAASNYFSDPDAEFYSRRRHYSNGDKRFSFVSNQKPPVRDIMQGRRRRRRQKESEPQQQQQQQLSSSYHAPPSYTSRSNTVPSMVVTSSILFHGRSSSSGERLSLSSRTISTSTTSSSNNNNKCDKAPRMPSFLIQREHIPDNSVHDSITYNRDNRNSQRYLDDSTSSGSSNNNDSLPSFELEEEQCHHHGHHHNTQSKEQPKQERPTRKQQQQQKQQKKDWNKNKKQQLLEMEQQDQTTGTGTGTTVTMTTTTGHTSSNYNFSNHSSSKTSSITVTENNLYYFMWVTVPAGMSLGDLKVILQHVPPDGSSTCSSSIMLVGKGIDTDEDTPTTTPQFYRKFEFLNSFQLDLEHIRVILSSDKGVLIIAIAKTNNHNFSSSRDDPITIDIIKGEPLLTMDKGDSSRNNHYRKTEVHTPFPDTLDSNFLLPVDVPGVKRDDLTVQYFPNDHHFHIYGKRTRGKFKRMISTIDKNVFLGEKTIPFDPKQLRGYLSSGVVTIIAPSLQKNQPQQGYTTIQISPSAANDSVRDLEEMANESMDNSETTALQKERIKKFVVEYQNDDNPNYFYGDDDADYIYNNHRHRNHSID